MLSTADITRFDILEMSVRNWPERAFPAQAYRFGFALEYPTEISEIESDFASCTLECEVSVVDDEYFAKLTPEEQDATEDHLEAHVWLGEFKFGFQVSRDVFFAHLAESSNGVDLISSAWPYARSQVMQVIRSSVDAPPLPFDIASVIKKDPDTE